ncbi:DUF924 domain-containing protein [Sphingorhabdus soli]|uniref:DUF924 domain-containing protein n=1 Tax=Flavisphingopyxis soli TaxID=2601267 RepID=A0A5C6US79_9SPHN|nr:DUF924 family protein [Sphingorhabdus soli]TXC73665.1 DUF924 domain-containing protein [Sphingorhabdus soli]
MSDWPATLLTYWFDELDRQYWFAGNDGVDAEIGARFGGLWEAQRSHPVVDFLNDPETARAAVLLFDQVPRNMFRDDPRAFATDPLARAIATAAVEAGWEQGLSLYERQFLYMPLMHSEDIGDQQRSLALFSGLGDPQITDYARKHYETIERFGRFPHRNAVLGRDSTPEEIAAIAAGAHW